MAAHEERVGPWIGLQCGARTPRFALKTWRPLEIVFHLYGCDRKKVTTYLKK